MDRDLSISRQVATEVVALVSEKFQEQKTSTQFFATSDKLVEWILAKGKTKDVLISRQAALKRAAYSINIVGIKNWTEFINFANELYRYY